MYCKNCGSILTENDQFCKNCGASVEAPISEQTTSDLEVSTQPEVIGVSAPQVLGNASVEQPVAESVSPVTPEISTADPVAPVAPVAPAIPEVPTVAPVVNQMPVQPMQQPVVNQPSNKNSNALKYILIGLAAAIVVLVGVLFLTNKNNKKPDENTPIEETSTYKIEFNNFEFSIPEELVYKTQSDQLLIGDEYDTWAVGIEIVEADFSQAKANKLAIKANLEKAGYQIGTIKNINSGNREFITYEATTDSTKVLVAYAKLNSTYVAALVLVNVDNTFDYSLIDEISPIISSAKYVASSNSISENNKLDLKSTLLGIETNLDENDESAEEISELPTNVDNIENVSEISNDETIIEVQE